MRSLLDSPTRSEKWLGSGVSFGAFAGSGPATSRVGWLDRQGLWPTSGNASFSQSVSSPSGTTLHIPVLMEASSSARASVYKRNGGGEKAQKRAAAGPERCRLLPALHGY